MLIKFLSTDIINLILYQRGIFLAHLMPVGMFPIGPESCLALCSPLTEHIYYPLSQSFSLNRAIYNDYLHVQVLRLEFPGSPAIAYRFREYN